MRLLLLLNRYAASAVVKKTAVAPDHTQLCSRPHPIIPQNSLVSRASPLPHSGKWSGERFN